MPAALAGVEESRRARAGLAVALAELEAGERADLLDDAGLGDVRADARHALHHVAGADDPADALGALHAVLEGEDRRALGDQRLQAFARRSPYRAS